MGDKGSSEVSHLQEYGISLRRVQRNTLRSVAAARAACFETSAIT